MMAASVSVFCVWDNVFFQLPVRVTVANLVDIVMSFVPFVIVSSAHHLMLWSILVTLII